VINIYFYILLASALFTIGVIGLFLHKNRLYILLSTQLILSSAIIIGLLFSQKFGHDINLFIIVILLVAFFMFLISSIYEYKNSFNTNQSLSDREL